MKTKFTIDFIAIIRVIKYPLKMNFSAVEFDKSELSRDVSGMLSITLEEHDPLYKYLVVYIAKNLAGPGHNLFTSILSAKPSEADVKDKNVHGRIVFKLGTGEYSFRAFDGKILYALHHHLGDPVGTDCGVKIMKRLVIFTEGSWEELASFLNTAVERMETTDDGQFICYTWKIRYGYWNEDTKVNKRPIESVVLPSALKSRMVNDMAKFLDSKTKNFYLRNGIPYRRSYLFFGTPGTGKTSMVQALASHFGRNVCFLMPTHPEMTDDSLRSAVNSIPENSIVVFEDIDALFDKDRSNQIQKSSLTFSGLLNALDGIGNANGQIFVLTTNLRENLDHALIRNGRVDIHFEFTYAVAEQMELMWRNFYPSASEMAKDFSATVSNLLSRENLQVTTAALQHYFVTQMDSSPEEALANVGSITEELHQNSSKSMLKEATVAAVPAATDNSGKKDKKKKQKSNKKANANGEKPTTTTSDAANAETVANDSSNASQPTKEPVPVTTESVSASPDVASTIEKTSNKKNKNKKNRKAKVDADVSHASSAESKTEPAVVNESVPISASADVASTAEKKGNKKNKNKNKKIKEGKATADTSPAATTTETEVGKNAEGLDPAVVVVVQEPSDKCSELLPETSTENNTEVLAKDSDMSPLSKRQKKNRKQNKSIDPSESLIEAAKAETETD